MSTETQKVDVLAVMDALAAQTKQRGGSPSVKNIETARAAVAELIGSAKRFVERDSVVNHHRLIAALARVGGDA